MKTPSTALLVALLVFVTLPAAAQRSFEGVLEGRLMLTVGPGEVTLYAAPEGLRAEATISPLSPLPVLQRREVFLLRAAEPDTVYRLQPDEGTYSVLDVEETAERTLRPRVEYSVERTGETEIAGLPVVRSEVTTSVGDRFVIWTTPALPDASALLQAIGIDAGDGLFAALEEAGIEGAIVRLHQYKGMNVVPSMTFEVTNIDRRDLDPSLFRLPPDLRRVEPAA